MPPSFQSLLDANQRRVLRAALGFMRDVDAAEEAAQESLLKAYAARERYDDTRPFYPWIYRIVRNTCFDLLAKRKRRPRAAVEMDELPDARPLPDEEVRRKQDAARLWAGMETLSEEHREILNFRHFQDLSYPEIAELLEVPEGTVMSRLFRARRALARAVEAAETSEART